MELVGFQHLDLLAAADVKTVAQNVSTVWKCIKRGNKERTWKLIEGYVTLNILQNNILMVSFVYLPDHNFLKLY